MFRLRITAAGFLQQPLCLIPSDPPHPPFRLPQLPTGHRIRDLPFPLTAGVVDRCREHTEFPIDGRRCHLILAPPVDVSTYPCRGDRPKFHASKGVPQMPRRVLIAAISRRPLGYSAGLQIPDHQVLEGPRRLLAPLALPVGLKPPFREERLGFFSLGRSRRASNALAAGVCIRHPPALGVAPLVKPVLVLLAFRHVSVSRTSGPTRAGLSLSEFPRST